MDDVKTCKRNKKIFYYYNFLYDAFLKQLFYKLIKSIKILFHMKDKDKKRIFPKIHYVLFLLISGKWPKKELPKSATFFFIRKNCNKLKSYFVAKICHIKVAYTTCLKKNEPL